MQPPLNPSGKGSNQHHAYNAAASRQEISTIQSDVSKSGVAYQSSQNTAQNWSAAEYLSRVETDKEIHSPEYGIAGNCQQFDCRQTREGRINLHCHSDAAGYKSASNKTRYQGNKYTCNLFEEELGGGGVLRSDLLVKCLAVTYLRLVRNEIF